jgi:hypothetical protein
VHGINLGDDFALDSKLQKFNHDTLQTFPCQVVYLRKSFRKALSLSGFSLSFRPS